MAIPHQNEYRTITEAAEQLQVIPGGALKPLFEHLEGHYEYYKLRVALSIWERGNNSWDFLQMFCFSEAGKCFGEAKHL